MNHKVRNYQYHLEVQALAGEFEYELCEVCERDLDAHVIAPDPLGHPHLFCIREEVTR